ncbi:SufD family Fe-S cluster assembly protein [Candidatus Peregrinibacteria bacterium]|nr:SufD family Fe-S cluster assembly protein [Candidatus Peregrinibacteria bacterium]
MQSQNLIQQTELKGEISLSSGFFWTELSTDCQIQIAEGQEVKLLIIARPQSKKLNIAVTLDNEARLEIVEYIWGKDEQKFGENWKIIHQGRNSVSRFSVKSVLNGASETDILADVFIPAGGNGSDTFLKLQSLLLSPEAHAKAIPSLEIIPNEVKAGHAATMGKVDEDILFYLESRGFEREQAERLLVEAFVKDGLKQFSSVEENLMLELERILLEKLDGGKIYSS